MAQLQMNRRSRSADLVSSGSPGTPDSFDYETKFIVLSFMSRSPEQIQERKTFSPQSSTSESDLNLFKRGKSSKSLPASPPKSRHIYRRNGHGHPNKQLKAMQRVSEDNIQYRYQKHQESYFDHHLETDGGSSDSFVKQPQNSSHSESSNEEQNSLTSLSEYRQTTMTPASRSQSTDYSYHSDADDEYEDTSCGSSLVESLSGSNSRKNFRQQGVDFLQVVSRLPTVKSESEMESADLPEDGAGEDDILEDAPPDTVDDYLFNNDPALSTSISIAASTENSSGPTSATKLDRSKLKLNISAQTSIESTKYAKLESVAASLRAEFEDEMTSFESEVEEAIKRHAIEPSQTPFLTPLSPESEVARFLAVVGDQMQDEYREQLELSVQHLLHRQFTYEDFRSAATDIIDHNLPGWRQVVLLMLYGKKAAWKVVESGQTGIGDLVDYTSRLVADLAADFIITQGGWGAVMNSDPSQSSDSPENHQDTPPASRWISSPIGDTVALTPALSLTEITPIFKDEEVTGDVADGDHTSLSSPVIHVANSPQPMDGWMDKTSNAELESDTSTLVGCHADQEGTNQANNNSSTLKKQYKPPDTPFLMQDGNEYDVDLSSSSDEDNMSDDEDINVNRRSWMHWFIIPEHITLLTILLAGIGIGAFITNRSKS